MSEKIGASFYPESSLQSLERVCKIIMFLKIVWWIHPFQLWLPFYEQTFKVDLI